MRIHFRFVYKYQNVAIEIHGKVTYKQVSMEFDILTPALRHLVGYDVTLSLGDNTVNLITWWRIAIWMGCSLTCGVPQGEFDWQLLGGQYYLKYFCNALSGSFLNEFWWAMRFQNQFDVHSCCTMSYQQRAAIPEIRLFIIKSSLRSPNRHVPFHAVNLSTKIASSGFVTICDCPCSLISSFWLVSFIYSKFIGYLSCWTHRPREMEFRR